MTETRNEKRSSRTRTTTVLVVEQNKVARKLHVDFLENEGHKVITVEDWPEAKRMLALHPQNFDLVLLDTTTPQRDGSEIFLFVSSAYPLIRNFLDDGGNVETMPIVVRDSPLVHILQKPYSLLRLHSAIRDITKAYEIQDFLSDLD